MVQITMKEMLDAGVHFGHQVQRWNPQMKNYVFGVRGGIHIIDLQKSLSGAQRAIEFTRKLAANGGGFVFVGTKKQAVEPIQEAAKKCGQFYVTKRWLGGTLTNFTTIKTSIDRLKRLDMMKEKGEWNYFSKKERAKMEKEYQRLNEYLEGIREMRAPPAAMFVVDLKKEHIAIAEAKRLGIPVVGIADTNSDPTQIDYPIPGNDDAIRSIKLFANLVAEAYNEGAKDYEMKIRASTDKASDTEKEARAPRAAAAAAPAPTDTKTAGGPSVVKVTKTRKLVAAGLADDVEIQMELEKNAEDVPAEETFEETTSKGAQGKDEE
ncbi:MAG TPA: 30S ribosomal protein S2 [Bdellovibrionales bacterium]|nr:30S ribosomal protein S2 [Bdellovibrionales bacterium]